MKVLKHGNEYKNSIVVCWFCACKFEYHKTDVTLCSYNQMDDVVKCPECGNETMVYQRSYDVSF